jgi:hypothetical protein
MPLQCFLIMLINFLPFLLLKKNYLLVGRSDVGVGEFGSSYSGDSQPSPRHMSADGCSSDVSQRKRMNRRSMWAESLASEGLSEYQQEIMELSENTLDRGTDLDVLRLSVNRSVIQLILVATENAKQRFVDTSAAALHAAGEIIRFIEIMEKEEAAKSHKFITVTAVRQRIRDIAVALPQNEFKDLVHYTTVAAGVWPPENAKRDMVAAAIALARSVKELVELANTSGFFPMKDITAALNQLEVGFSP